MLSIWHVANQEINSIGLWGTDKQEYIVITRGEYAPILSTGFSILINKELSLFFEHQFYTSSLHPVVIIDKVNNVESKQYSRLDILEEIIPENIERMNADGSKIWHFGKQYLFVSDDVKNGMVKSFIKGIAFTQGFGQFGAFKMQARLETKNLL